MFSNQTGRLKSFFLLGVVPLAFVLLFSLPRVSSAALVNSFQEVTLKPNVSEPDTGMTGQSGNMKEMMRKMHAGMMNIRQTGDPDHDFAAMIIAHNQGAIGISKSEVTNGKDENLISMAKNVIEEQTRDIENLQQYTTGDTATVGERMDHDKDMMGKRDSMMNHNDMTGSTSHQRMMDDMDKIQMTGDQDKDFASIMITHDQHTIDMATQYLQKGSNSDLKSTAQDLIKRSQDEIQKLKDWSSNQSTK